MFRVLKLSLVVACLFGGVAHAENGEIVVDASTAAPTGTLASFVQGTTNQWSIGLFKNPLASNTYHMTLFGVNPNFNAPASYAQMQNYVATVDSYTYFYGWAAGESYQTNSEEGFVGAMSNLCGSATNFALIQTSSKTFDKATCCDTLGTMLNQLFLESSSTVPVVGF